MRKLINVFGVMMFVIGVCLADSEFVIIPLSLVVSGILTLYLTER